MLFFKGLFLLILLFLKKIIQKNHKVCHSIVMKNFIDNSNKIIGRLFRSDNPDSIIRRDKQYSYIGSESVNHRFDKWRGKKLGKAVGLSFASLLLLPLISSSFRKNLVKNWKKGISGKQIIAVYQLVHSDSKDPSSKRSSLRPELGLTEPHPSDLKPELESDYLAPELYQNFSEIAIVKYNQNLPNQFIELCKKTDFVNLSSEKLEDFLTTFRRLSPYLDVDTFLKNISLSEAQISQYNKYCKDVTGDLEAFLKFKADDDLLFSYYADISHSWTDYYKNMQFKSIIKLAEGRENRADFLKDFLLDDTTIDFLQINSETLANKLLGFAFEKKLRHKNNFLKEIVRNKPSWLLSNSDDVLASYLEQQGLFEDFFIKFLINSNRFTSVAAHLKSNCILQMIKRLKDLKPLTEKRSEADLKSDLIQLLKNDNKQYIDHFISAIEENKRLSVLQSLEGEALAKCLSFITPKEQDQLLGDLLQDAESVKKIKALLDNLTPPRAEKNFYVWKKAFDTALPILEKLWKALSNQTEIDIDPLYIEFLHDLSQALHPVLFNSDHKTELNNYLTRLLKLISESNLQNCLQKVMQKAENKDSLGILEVLPLVKFLTFNAEDGIFRPMVERLESYHIGYLFVQADLNNKVLLLEVLSDNHSSLYSENNLRDYLGEEKYQQALLVKDNFKNQQVVDQGLNKPSYTIDLPEESLDVID